LVFDDYLENQVLWNDTRLLAEGRDPYLNEL